VSDFKLKFTKLDKRYQGYGVFSHYVQIQSAKGIVRHLATETSLFNKFRTLCVETWGMSTERDTYIYLRHAKQYVIHPQSEEMYDLNEYWAWHTEREQRRIYLTEKGKTWVELAWM
jgi:hypothetical protein